MRIAAILLVLVAAVGATMLALPPAEAGPGAQIYFEETVQKTAASVEEANARVLDALAKQEFGAWSQAHDAYIQALVRAVPEIERAIGKYMLGTLDGGGTLDKDVLDAIDAAAEQAALYAKQRVMTGAYATLTRRGVRPDSRGAALKLLEKQGVYALDRAVQGTQGTTVVRGLGESPMHGRVPTTPEAAEHLSKWQQAYMAAGQIGPRVASYESQIESLPADAPNRGDIIARLEQAKAQHQQLLKAVEQYRTLYFEAGGK